MTGQSIHEAAKLGDDESVKSIIDADSAMLNHKLNGFTPLVLAAGNGRASTCEILLKSGADPNVTARNGTTPLILSAIHGYADVARILVKHGAEVNRADKKQWTPLMHAAQYDSCLNVIVALVELGASPALKAADGRVALDIAYQGKQAIAAYGLLKCGSSPFDSLSGQKPRGRKWFEEYALAIGSISTNNLEVLRQLLGDGLSADFRANNGETLLMIAAQNGYIEAIELLLQNGADCNGKAPGGWDPLIFSALGGHTRAVFSLLAAGADVGYKMKTGPTALWAASRKGHFAIAQAILTAAKQQGRVIDIRESLIVATEANDTEMIRLLKSN